MSMREILNAARREAAQVMAEHANTRIGIVRSYDGGKSYAVRVEVQPEGNLTGWIPLLSPWVGNGWGMFCPPSVGDLVELEFQESDHDSAMSCMRFFNDENRPLPVPSGEFWLVHKSGSFLKFHNDGTIEVSAHTAINSSAPAWNHTGPLNVNGKVTATDTITAPLVVGTTNVTFGGKSGVNHVHTGVQTGSGNTGQPA